MSISIKLGEKVIMPHKNKPVAFVLMSFNPDFDDLYELGIKAACQFAGVECSRVDEQLFDDDILTRIYKQIEVADVVISEMTGRNPNVFYETGYAHALGKRVILIANEKEDIPFDLGHYPHIIYRRRIQHLKSELEKKLKWHINNPVAASDMINRIGTRNETILSSFSFELLVHSFITIPIRPLVKNDEQNEMEEQLNAKPFTLKVATEKESFIMNGQIFNNDGVLIGEIHNPFNTYISDYITTISTILESKKAGGIDSVQKTRSDYILENAEFLDRKPDDYWLFIKIPGTELDLVRG